MRDMSHCPPVVVVLFPLHHSFTAHMAAHTAVLPPEVKNKPSTPAPSQTKPITQPETSLENIPDTMENSDLFRPAGKDIATDFWTTYERVAKQHDDEFIDRHIGDLDALLIFAGLFSSVSSTFIVNMASNLSPQPSDTTNALLKILINKVDNGTFSEQDASLPVWTGPGSMIIWIQSLAYTSLSMSLLAAFGGVLGKQWLGHFKTSRLRKGTLRERCTRRQQKLDGLKTWHLNTIIACLPILLQLSLLFFGVALAANIWTQQHTVAGVIMGTTSFGAIFYSFTVVASLKSPDCPFQTPVSTILSGVVHVFRDTIMLWAHRVRAKSWAGFLHDLPELLRSVFKSALDMISSSMACFLAYLARIPLRQITILPTDDPESAGGSHDLTSVNEYLRVLQSPAEPTGARSIQWIIETDTDLITLAGKMVPEVEWPDEWDIAFMLERLTSHLNACFDSPGQLAPRMREQVRICCKAIFHLYTERGLRGPLNIRGGSLFYSNRFLYPIPLEQDFQLITCVMDWPNELDVTSLPFSDRMWMARILTYRLHSGDRSSFVLAFVHDFIDKCLYDSNSPPRLVADCLVLAGLMVGLRPDRRYLAKIDKSAAIRDHQSMVINRILYSLLSNAPVSNWRRYGRNLLRPLAYSKHHQHYGHYRRSVDCLELSFRLLEDPRTAGTLVQFTEVGAALRLSLHHSLMVEEFRIWTFLYRTASSSRDYWGGPPDWHTQAQFDLLVDYLVEIGKGADYDAVGDAFAVLAGLRGSPSNLKRKRLYIQTIIRFMELEIPLRTCHAAMSAAYAIRAEVTSMGRDDEPLRNHFSQALVSVMRARIVPQDGTLVNHNPFNELSSVNWRRNRCYLGLLCALSAEPTWHDHLDYHGHFKNCLAIAYFLSTRLRTNPGNEDLGLHLVNIFAIVDNLGKDHQFLEAVQTYPMWPIILRAWRYLFAFPFFHEATVENWNELSSRGIIESLPSVAAYAMKYWQRWDNKAKTCQLIRLVEQVCDKLDEEKEREEVKGWSATTVVLELGEENVTFGHRGIPTLSKGIRKLLDVLS